VQRSAEAEEAGSAMRVIAKTGVGLCRQEQTAGGTSRRKGAIQFLVEDRTGILVVSI
jgi:hypothetical protein